MNHSSWNCPKYVRRTNIGPVKKGLYVHSSVLLYVHTDHKGYYVHTDHKGYYVHSSVLLYHTDHKGYYVHTDHKGYYGQGAKGYYTDGRLDFHTPPEL